MDYKEKVIALLNSKELTKEQKEKLDEIFPELKESENEKTKRILHSISSKISFYLHDVFTEEEFQCFDAWSNVWIEKQGEHTNFLNNIQIGDKVTRNRDGVLVNLSQLNRVAKKDEKQGEQKHADKVELKQEELTKFEKAVKQVMEETIECGDTHNLKADADMLLNLVQKSVWSEEDIMRINNLIAIIENRGYPDYVEYLEKLKDRVQLQPKQEWSEEDEKHLNRAINVLDASKIYTKSPDKYEDTINWLKFLKDRVQPQSHWKPSDEQINTLEYYLHILVCNEYKEILFGLYTDLKKLREE